MNQLSQLAPAIFAALMTYVSLPHALVLFPEWKLLDRPERYGLTRKPIPYSGGIVIFLVVLIGTLLFVELSPIIIGVIVAATLVTLVSFWDDRKNISPWIRLATQVLAGAILVFSGVEIQQISNPFGEPILLDRFSFEIFGQTIWLLSAVGIIIWIVLMMNVMNWLDGIPGLTSGISTIAHASLYLLAIQQFHIVDQSAVITMASMLAAASLVFLCFDFTPPKILMGDTGSMFLGFMLAALSIIAGAKFATALLIMGFAVIDAVWVVLARMLRGKSPIRGDLSHFHHRLLGVGISERGVLFLNYLLCLIFASIALVLNNAFEKFVALVVVILIMVIIGVVLIKRKIRS